MIQLPVPPIMFGAIMLHSLKMYGMAQAVTDLIKQGAPAFGSAIPILSQLLKAELTEREVRSIRLSYEVGVRRENSPRDCFLARLTPAYKDLSGFDFAASEVGEATIRIGTRIISAFTPDQRQKCVRLNELPVTSATEGAMIPRAQGRMQVGGNTIWATDFREAYSIIRKGCGGKDSSSGVVI